MTSAVESRRVFVVYGRNRRAHAAAVLQLRALGADPLDFEHIRARLGGTPFVGDVVREGLREAPAVLVLLTPDEYSTLGKGYRIGSEGDLGRWQPRPNVCWRPESRLALTNTEQSWLQSALLNCLRIWWGATTFGSITHLGHARLSATLSSPAVVNYRRQTRAGTMPRSLVTSKPRLPTIRGPRPRPHALSSPQSSLDCC
jgi:hypothetical protein